MYGTFTYIYHKFKPNVGKNSIHGASGVTISEYICITVRIRAQHRNIAVREKIVCSKTTLSTFLLGIAAFSILDPLLMEKLRTDLQCIKPPGKS